MRLSQYRSRLLTWLEQQVIVDRWNLNAPETPDETVGFIAPLRDTLYEWEDATTVSMEAVQDIWIQRRFSGDIAYHDLPWDTLYGYYQTLAIRLVHAWKRINPEFSTLELLRGDRPIGVLEKPDERRDWVVQLNWTFRFTAMAEPESGSVVTPFPVSQITAGLWITKLEDPEFSKEESKLDARLDFTLL